MTCPISHCSVPVEGPLRVCKEHYRHIPRPQAEALSFYAKKNKRGRAHTDAFERAVDSIEKLIASRRPKPVERPAPAMPYRDD